VAAGLEKVLKTGLISPEAIQLRYDPIIRVRAPDGRILRNDTSRAFEKVFSLFAELGVRIVEIKFLLIGKESDEKYHHVWQRIQKAGVTPLEINNIPNVYKNLSDVAVKYGMQLFSCSVKEEQNLPGWKHDAGCLSASRYTQVGKRLFGESWDRLSSFGRSSRPGCQCSHYIDLSNIKGHKKCGSQDAACIYCTASAKNFGTSIKNILTKEIKDFNSGKRDDFYQHLLEIG